MGRWWAIDPALQSASPYMAMGNNPMMYTDADGRIWGIFKAMGQAWDYVWDKGNQFARWADEVGIPSFNVGVGMNSGGQISPLVNGQAINNNPYGSDQNVITGINNARGDYFSQQQMNTNYSQQLNDRIMSIPYATMQNNKNVTSSGGDDGLTFGAISLFAAKYENVFKNYTSGSYKPITGGSNPMGWSATPKTRYVPGLGDVNRSFMQQARSLLKYGGYGMTAYGFYQTQMAYDAGQISLAEYRGDIAFGIIGTLGWQGALFNFSYQMGKLNGSRHDYKPYQSILNEHLK